MIHDMHLCCLQGSTKAKQGTAAAAPAAAARKAEGAVPRDIGTWETGIPGIRRVQRNTGQARRAIRTEYIMKCKHGSFRHDRIPRMVDFFQQHSGCRCVSLLPAV